MYIHTYIHTCTYRQTDRQAAFKEPYLCKCVCGADSIIRIIFLVTVSREILNSKKQSTDLVYSSEIPDHFLWNHICICVCVCVCVHV